MSSPWREYDRRERTTRTRRGGRGRAVVRPTTLAEVVDPAHLYGTLLLLLRSAGQAPGIDGVRYDDLSKGEWYQCFRDVRDAVLAGTYRPQPHRLVSIAKAGGGTRTLRLAVTADRVLEKTVADALQPHAERVAQPCSNGFRPGRDRFGMLAELKVATEVDELWVHVTDDIKKAFDFVPVDTAVTVLRRLEADPALTELAAILVTCNNTTNRGIPQGGALSPICLNLVLTDLDTEMTAAVRCGRNRVWYGRYADNLHIAARTPTEGVALLDQIRDHLSGMGLNLKGPGTPCDLTAGEGLDLLGLRIRKANGQLGLEIPHSKWDDLRSRLISAHDQPDPTRSVRTLATGWIEAHAPASGNNTRTDEENVNRMVNLLTRTGHRDALTRQEVTHRMVTTSRRWARMVTETRRRLTTGTVERSPTTETVRDTTHTTVGPDTNQDAIYVPTVRSDETDSRTDRSTTVTDTATRDSATHDLSDHSLSSFSSRPSGRSTALPDPVVVPPGAHRRDRHTTSAHRYHHSFSRPRHRIGGQRARPPPVRTGLTAATPERVAGVTTGLDATRCLSRQAGSNTSCPPERSSNDVGSDRR